MRAYTARTGLLPLGVNEGILLKTRVDSEGRPLTRNCSYRLSSPLPPALLWTLTPTDIDGGILPNQTGRANITSDHLLRDSEGAFEIVISRDVQPGNWLPLGPYQTGLDGYTREPLPRSEVPQNQPFVLSLRIYSANLSADNPLEKILFPSIIRAGCSS